MPLQPLSADIGRLIRGVVSDGSGISPTNIIPGDDNHPRPVTPYGSVKHISTRTIGIDQEIHRANADDPENKVEIFTIGNRVTTYSIQFYKDGADDNARLARRYFQKISSRIKLLELGIVFLNATDVLDITAAVASKNEQRVVFTAQFSYTETDDPEIVDTLLGLKIAISETAETDLEEEIEVEK